MFPTHPHVAAAGVGVQVMGVDVEGDKADGREGWGVDDGHVVGGADADGGHVGARARAHVGDAVLEGGGEKWRITVPALPGGGLSQCCHMSVTSRTRLLISITTLLS